MRTRRYQHDALGCGTGLRAEAAIQHALALAQSFEFELHLLTVIDRDPNATDSFDWRLRQAHAKSYLSRLQDRLSEQPFDVSSRC
jgi:hypothetical protein